MERTAQGKLRCVDAQGIAASNARQANAPEDVKQLAALGANGTWTNNLERDLFVAYSDTVSAKIKSYTIWMDLELHNQKFTLPLEVPFLFPTNVIGAIYDCGAIQIARSILGENYPESADVFWRNARSQTWGAQHPDLQGLSFQDWGLISLLCKMNNE